MDHIIYRDYKVNRRSFIDCSPACNRLVSECVTWPSDQDGARTEEGSRTHGVSERSLLPQATIFVIHADCSKIKLPWLVSGC